MNFRYKIFLDYLALNHIHLLYLDIVNYDISLKIGVSLITFNPKSFKICDLGSINFIF